MIDPHLETDRLSFSMNSTINPAQNHLSFLCARPEDRSLQQLKARKYKSLRTIAALILREMGSTYGKSPGGYFWAIAEPVAAIAVLSVAFQMVFRSPSLGTNFPLFFATGFLPFTLANDIAVKVSRSIHFSKPLLFYPAVTIFDTIVARMILSLVTNLTISIIVLVTLHIVFDVHSLLRVEAIGLSLAMGVSLGAGIGILNCYLINAFGLWEQVWGIVTRPLFLASGVLFLFETLPPIAQDILWFNPFLHVVGMMRVGFYATYDAAYLSPIYVFGASWVAIAVGLLLLKRHARKLIHG